MTEAIEELYRRAPVMEPSYIAEALRLDGSMAAHVGTLTGGITPDEAQMLFELVRSLQPTTTLEIGLGYGFSAMVICEAAERNTAGRKHVVIDPHQITYWKRRGLEHLEAAGHGEILEFHEGRSFDVLPALLKAGCQIDFAFIDGWHTFDYVFTDFFFVDKMLRPGGVVVFDDADWPSIRPVLRYIVTNLDYSVHRTLPVQQSTEQIDLELGLEGSCIALRKNSDRPRDIFFHQPFTTHERRDAKQKAPTKPARRPTLSAIVNTCGGAPIEHLRRLIQQLTALSDEVILFVDEITPTDFVEATRRFCGDVRMLRHRDSPQKFVREMLGQCACDFILRLNDDELLSDNWTRAFLDELMSDAEVNAYWIARKWLVDDEGRYVSSPPHFPDFQVRLTRNNPSMVHTSDVLHLPPRVEGESGWISSHAILHYDLAWRTRAEREAKVQRYAALRPEYTGAEFYLFEDLPHTVSDCGSGDAFAAEVRVLAPPEQMVCGREYSLRVLVDNCSSRVLSSHAQPPVRLSYHWFRDDAGRSIVLWDGVRTLLRARDGLTECVGRVTAPSEPGDYLLQIDLVEEGVQWFSDKAAQASAFPLYRIAVVSGA